MLAAGHVDADDGDVGAAAAQRVVDGGGEAEGVGGVGDGDPVGDAELVDAVGLVLVADDGEDVGGAGVLGGGEGEGTGLARGAEDGDGGAGVVAAGDDAADEGGGAADVEDGERELLGEVVGDRGGDGAAEEDGGARCGDLLGTAVPALQTISDAQRGEGEGDEGGDLLADFEAERGAGPTASTVPMSMPPEPVTGFCILPRASTMARTSSRTAAPSPPCLVRSCR
nr:hypothetical protein GCM10025732_42470 [Glycomyces mayteni]